jgi:hypothetical protein
MSSYAILPIGDTGTVINVVEWDGDTNKWNPPEGFQAIPSDVAGIGWTYDAVTKSFTAPEQITTP